MRKKRTIQLTIAIISLLLSSCQKVINLDLGSSVPQLVIQGNVYDQVGPYIVTLSKTVNFDAPNIYPPVTNATVTISDNAGNSEVLSQTIDGTYVTSALQGVIGRTYTLNVSVDGKTYTASSTMPEAVSIDSIYFIKAPFGKITLVGLDILNLPNKDNYYRVINFVNDKQSTGFSVFNENTSNAVIINYSFLPSTNPTVGNPQKLAKGDKIDVWLECIDKGVFEYFRSANREGGQNASPANPVSNISNGALGYFNACSIRKNSITYQ
jgi:hypothetical protein